jgi:hypothetical protein
MRKAFSILFVLIVTLTATHITVATHLCGGEIAATKVSLSGKLATCGMEGTEESCPSSGNQFSNYCCDNQVTTIGIITNFTTPVSLTQEIIQNNDQLFYVPVSELFHSISANNITYTSFNPPGRFLTSSVRLSDICVFRI